LIVTEFDRFIRHAERFGTEEVFEVAAADGFTATELGRLTLALRRVDPDWRLSRDQREDLFAELDAAGVPDRRLREFLGISQKTLSRERNRSRRAEKNGQNGDPGIGVQISLLRAEEALIR
jgi:hypothetical protein